VSEKTVVHCTSILKLQMHVSLALANEIIDGNINMNQKVYNVMRQICPLSCRTAYIWNEVSLGIKRLIFAD
jgi:hypothetical protein